MSGHAPLKARPFPKHHAHAPAALGWEQQFHPPCLHRPDFPLSWSFQLAQECTVISPLSEKKPQIPLGPSSLHLPSANFLTRCLSLMFISV